MKQIKDFIIIRNIRLNDAYSKMILTPADGESLPKMSPGQFVQISVDAPDVFLRRPISVNDVDPKENTITLLIRNAGKGTTILTSLPSGNHLNILLPLGNGFTTEIPENGRVLLIGGGVGVAPLLYLGKTLKNKGFKPEFLLGARTSSDLLSIDEFRETGTVYTCTEDGSDGIQGLVTSHPILNESFCRYYCCGPAPMMKAVAKIARQNGIDCEVSLENMMACGLGACLCCIEKTVKGNVCVCTEGPVFNISSLTWN